MSWWNEAVFYHVYVRSYMDSNADGIGDLRGLIGRLDYLEWLGVGAICLSPVYPSPQVDFGYDVAEFCDIDPVFGTLEDFDRLVQEAHRHDIRLVIDQIYHAVSSRHAWFLESRASRENAKSDWFVWRDPNPLGGPPNNWLSFFCGSREESAWTWVEEREQYFLHLFSSDQCDLNLRHSEVRRELERVARFWLDRGVDGFRLDSIGVYFKDPSFRDYRRRPRRFPGAESSALSQYYVDNNLDRPENLLAAERIREIAEEYRPDRVLIGESASENGIAAYLDLCKTGRLHLAFNFELLNAAGLDGARLQAVVNRTDALFEDRAWPAWVFGNHDGSRLLSRVASARNPQQCAAVAKLLAALLLTLRGTPFIYYGEEIGMTDTPIPRERVRDPLGAALWPSPGRDVSRTPMQWDAGETGGFSPAEPWLPVNRGNPSANVAAQRSDPDSILSFYRSLLALRRRRDELRRGRYLPFPCEGNVVSYARSGARGSVEVYLNFNDAPASCARRNGDELLLGSRAALARTIAGERRISLEPFEVLILGTRRHL